MEIQLQELIDQIKKDGVDAAETEASSILASATAQAEKIVADAKAEAAKLLQSAKSETERMVKSSEDAIGQAGRNVLISFRESVNRELGAILNESVAGVYSPDSLQKLIVKFVEQWAGKPDAEDISVILNSEDKKLLEDSLLAGLRDKMQQGVTLKASDSFDGGFRIAVNGGQAFYDYSAEAVVDMMSNYLSPRVTEILKEAE
ncbi:MAG: V-type ATP synthase subunit E family protein [Firmicutes bacterium]|nr:V-type ATP synthase subunit E family protein [Bacillota bacterium]